jgi:hypothetical protein
VTVATGLIGGLVYLLGPPLKSEMRAKPSEAENDTIDTQSFCSVAS